MNENDIILELLRQARVLVTRNPDLELPDALSRVTSVWYMKAVRSFPEPTSVYAAATQAERQQVVDAAIAKLQSSQAPGTSV